MKTVCVSCGIEWKNDGWVSEHKPMCANDRYGWAYTRVESLAPEEVKALTDEIRVLLDATIAKKSND